MRRALLVCLAASAAHAAPDLTPSEILARIRARMAQALSGLPNYTCRETIERSVRTAGAKRFETQDLLRLEVAYLEGREMFAWPGSPRFGEKKIEDLVPGGTVATGNFGALAQAVFVSGAATFTFQGPVSNDGQNQVRFDFRVARAQGAMTVGHGKSSAEVGYHGFFTANRDTFEVGALQVDADDVPFSVQIYQAQERMEYAVSRIGNSEYLLPKTSEVTLVDLGGQVSRNHVTLDACHEFTGESTISFTEPAAISETAGPSSGPQQLPAGTELAIRLTMPVERGVTAIGDMVSGEVIKEVRGAVAIPRGAEATLRITGIEDVTDGKIVLHGVSFQLLRVENRGRQYDVAGAVLRGAKGPGEYTASKEGGVLFRGPSFRLAPGYEMTWRTVKSP